MMMPSRSAMVTVPVCTTGWPAKSLLAGTSVQVPFRELWSRAKAETVNRRVVKTAPVIAVVEYVLMISFQGGYQSTHSAVQVKTEMQARSEDVARPHNVS